MGTGGQKQVAKSMKGFLCTPHVKKCSKTIQFTYLNFAPTI